MLSLFHLDRVFSLLLLPGTLMILASESPGENMCHFNHIDSVDHDDTICVPAPVATTPEIKNPEICAYCLYPIEDNVLQTCTECRGRGCPECIRALFVVASKNESCMPPRCCGKAIPLAVGRQVLTGTEVETFKEKHEEWNTSGRSYCPMPRCSAFLPPSMFPELRASFSGEMSSVVISCPQCDTEVCTSCVTKAHPGKECIRGRNLEPELARALDKIDAKQCPKCRVATEKDGDCSSMRCWCGANWCWYCRRTISSCILHPCEVIKKQLAEVKDKGCNNECIDNDPAIDGNGAETTPFPDFVDYSSDEPEENAGAVIQDPDVLRVVPFDCLHEWIMAEQWEFNVELQFECERCWGQVFPFVSCSVKSSGDYDYRRVYKKSKVKNDMELLADDIMFTCGRCSFFVCNSCRKEIDA